MAVSIPPDRTGNLPPQNLEAETSVLGAILLSEQALDGILIDVKLKPEDFYRERHRLIFRAMIRLKEKQDPDPIDVLTVCAELQARGELEEAGGEAFVHSLPALVPVAAHVRNYAKIVKETSLLRRVLDTTRQIQEDVFNSKGEARDLLEKAEADLFKVAHDDRTRDLRSIEEVLHDELDKLEQVSREGISLTGTASGFKDLDDMTGGFQPGNLIVLAARPAMGKSSLVTNMAENAAINYGHPVALFSLEMSETELAQRFIASQAKLNGDDLRKGRVKPDRWPKVVNATGKLAASPLYVDDSSDLGVLELRAKVRRLHARQPLGLVVVDYLQLMRPEDSGVGRVEQIGQISRGLKVLAREIDVPVIAVSQLSRAVEARPDKRPLLSDLRESGCLTGDSPVYLPREGRYVPIAELSGRSGFQVLAVNTETWKLEPRRARGFSTGTKPVSRLTTRLGRTVRATANHKFLTVEGWRRLDELAEGDFIALPRRLPGPGEQTMSDAELALLGHLIGDGCTLPRHAIQYTTKESVLAQLVGGLALEVFGDRIAPRIKRERDWYQLYLASSAHLTHAVRNPVAEWLDRLGVFGKRAPEKLVPAQVFAQPDKAVARFLRHLWATDGCIWVGHGKREQEALYYATTSEQLARDVQRLLLRLEINARLSSTVHRTGRRQYAVTISGTPDQRRFLEKVGSVGDSDELHATWLRQRLETRTPNTNRDVVPAAVWSTLVRPSMAGAGITTRQMQAQIDVRYCGSTLYKVNLSRERAARVATVVESDELVSLAESDVYWDRIVSIEPDGVEEVYDLTVDDLHNFVAGDIVVHNSIEQDADLVMFIYRDEYYNKESERPGEADLIIAKHRNGPIGDVPLTFIARYPKFANLYRDPAGDIGPPPEAVD